jgi:hypothetical protein
MSLNNQVHHYVIFSVLVCCLSFTLLTTPFLNISSLSFSLAEGDNCTQALIILYNIQTAQLHQNRSHL